MTSVTEWPSFRGLGLRQWDRAYLLLAMLTNQVLAAFPFLCRISPESRRLLEAGGRIHNAHQTECLLRKDERIHGVYLVLTGRLRVYCISAGGEAVTLYSIEAGESCPLAMNAILADRAKVHQAWVQVESKTARIFFVSLAVFKDLYANEPAVREFALGVLSGRVSALMAALEELSLQPVRQRLKSYLRRKMQPGVELEITHQQMAEAIGTAREVISRKLRELVRTGTISCRRGRIRILKPHGLK